MKCKFCLIPRYWAILYYHIKGRSGWRFSIIGRMLAADIARWFVVAVLSNAEVFLFFSFLFFSFFCSFLMSWMPKPEQVGGGAGRGGALQAKSADHLLYVQKSSEWLSSNRKGGGFFFCCCCCCWKDWKITNVQLVRNNHFIFSFFPRRRRRRLASTCSRQGERIILHIPVFTRSLVL